MESGRVQLVEAFEYTPNPLSAENSSRSASERLTAKSDFCRLRGGTWWITAVGMSSCLARRKNYIDTYPTRVPLSDRGGPLRTGTRAGRARQESWLLRFGYRALRRGHRPASLLPSNPDPEAGEVGGCPVRC